MSQNGGGTCRKGGRYRTAADTIASAEVRKIVHEIAVLEIHEKIVN